MQGFEQAHIKDGIAMVRFSHWLKTDEARRQMTEADIASQLVSFRGQDAEYICDSFATIAGFNQMAQLFIIGLKKVQTPLCRVMAFCW